MYPLSGFEVTTKVMHVPWKLFKQNTKRKWNPPEHPQSPEVTIPSGFECSMLALLVRYADSHTHRQENQMSDEEICLSRFPIKQSGT